MSPGFEGGQVGEKGFPRVSGDEPDPLDASVGVSEFSPRERG